MIAARAAHGSSPMILGHEWISFSVQDTAPEVAGHAAGCEQPAAVQVRQALVGAGLRGQRGGPEGLPPAAPRRRQLQAVAAASAVCLRRRLRWRICGRRTLAAGQVCRCSSGRWGGASIIPSNIAAIAPGCEAISTGTAGACLSGLCTAVRRLPARHIAGRLIRHSWWICGAAKALRGRRKVQAAAAGRLVLVQYRVRWCLQLHIACRRFGHVMMHNPNMFMA